MGALVRERRTSAGLTQQELSIVSGVSIGALRDLEQGRTRCPRWGTVSAVAAVLGMDSHHYAELTAAGQADDTRQLSVPQVATGIRVTVLGPLSAARDGAAVMLGSVRQRAVLGLLAIHWPSVVLRDVIVEVLWGPVPPRSAVAQVQSYVSRLRRLLDPGRMPGETGGPIALDGRCYRLADGITLDLAEFGQLSRHADAAAARGEDYLACALYERSLGLWRDAVLADIDLLRGYPAVVEATRGRGEAVLRFARAAATGTWRERVLPHLRALCASEPFNEQAHAQLMMTLAAAGQPAAAVELFGRVRRRLDSELGVRPGPQLAEAHLRVLRQQVG